MSKTPRFSDDFPFEAVLDNPCLEDSGTAALAAYVGRYPRIDASATRHGYLRFRALLKDVKAPWKAEVEAHCDRMEANAYRHEFGKRYNRYARVSGGYEVSQTSELFSLFTQALHYDVPRAA